MALTRNPSVTIYKLWLFEGDLDNKKNDISTYSIIAYIWIHKSPADTSLNAFACVASVPVRAERNPDRANEFFASGPGRAKNGARAKRSMELLFDHKENISFFPYVIMLLLFHKRRMFKLET